MDEKYKLFEIINIGFIEFNKDKEILYINKYAKEFFKITSKINFHSESIKEQENKCKDLFENDIESESMCKIYIPEILWIKINRIINKNDKTYIYILENIDDVIQLQEKRINNTSSYFSNTTHQIRTPMNGIFGMITLLEDTNLSNEQKTYIEMLKESSLNLMSIINDILDFSKLQAGKIEINKKCVDLQLFIETTNDIILPKIYEKKLEYNYFIDSHLPKSLMIDENRLRQVILNLLNNSIKYTQDGSVLLNIKLEQSLEYLDNSDFHIIISITDTGCGIDEKDFNKLFKFSSELGTGLGLAISKELVNLMEGEIWIEKSQVNKGSCFLFSFKTSKCKKTLLENIEDKFEIFKNKKFFILDEKLENRLGISSIINKWGVEITTFSNSREALFFLKTKNYDIGLIDMPTSASEDFANQLDELNKNINRKNIPLIALTSLGDKCFKYIFNSHVIKPVNESKLKDACINILTKNIKTEDIWTSSDSVIRIKNIKDSIKILIVEDIKINQRVLVNFLIKLQYFHIDIAQDGKECLEYMTKNNYDLIFLDIKMPIINGEIVFNYIMDFYNYNHSKNYNSKNYNSKNYNYKAPLLDYRLFNVNKPYMIAVTAYSSKDDKNKYLKMGFDDYISKPININILNESMYKFINSLNVKTL